MFTAKRQVATVVGNCLRMLPGLPVSGQRVLMYHAVGNRVDGDVNNIYTMSRADFLRHIETLQAISAKYNIPFAPFRRSHISEMAVTFDDGYADALSTIGPELSNRGIPFHVFVTPEKLTSGDPRYLSTPELRELATIPGATIGAHGATHRSLTSLTIAEAEADLRNSKQQLEDVLQTPITSMSYPYGHVNCDVRAAVKQVGFIVAACSKWGINNEHSDALLLNRLDMWAGDNSRTIQNKVLGYWNFLGRRT
jgi:peptidoglycan/xylan/chitin deacetylase (PgdA/CDA1 family)